MRDPGSALARPNRNDTQILIAFGLALMYAAVIPTYAPPLCLVMAIAALGLVAAAARLLSWRPRFGGSAERRDATR